MLYDVHLSVHDCVIINAACVYNIYGKYSCFIVGIAISYTHDGTWSVVTFRSMSADDLSIAD